MMFQATGILKYGPGVKAAVEVDQGIADFYAYLTSLYIPINRQRYPAHISVVRKEQPPNMEVWGKYEGMEISFTYTPQVVRDETYFWLDVQCNKIQEIRVELGLTPYPWWRNKFHITIGNVKNLPPTKNEI